jgi:catechol 2,3-dioxygenase-like lactoylglutathione lyase family enzyme
LPPTDQVSKPTKIGNVILTVEDLDRPVGFYSDMLGLKVTRSIPGDFVFLDGGGVTLALRQASRPGPVVLGDVEVSFDVDDVQATYLSLKSKGVAFRTPPRAVTEDAEHRQLLAADFRDPDQHILSITGWSAKRI